MIQPSRHDFCLPSGSYPNLPPTRRQLVPPKWKLPEFTAHKEKERKARRRRSIELLSKV
jgi:hypothetical protein